MPRYIDADALRTEICKACDKQFETEPCEPNECEIIEAIEKAPTAYVQEVRHGHWIYTGVTNAYGMHEQKCSDCGYTFMASMMCGNTFLVSQMCDNENYCCNCGAKMDGKENTSNDAERKAD